MSWNSLQNDEDLDNFFDGIYERSWSHRMQPRATVEDTQDIDPHDLAIY